MDRMIVVIVIGILIGSDPCRAQTEGWEQLRGPYGGPISCMIMDESTGCLYLGAYGGILTSVNDGRNWDFIALNVYSSIIYCLFSDGDSMLLAGMEEGIYAYDSDDRSWEKRYETYNAHIIRNIHRNRVTGTLFACCSNSIILRSTDGGESWDRDTLAVRSIFINDVFCMTSDNEGNMYAATSDDGLWMSHDDGLSWDQVSEDGSMQALHAITYDQANDIVYVNSNDTVFVSTDNGQSWSGSRISLNTAIFPVRIDVRKPGIVLAGTDEGLFESTDFGKSWKHRELNIPDAAIFRISCVNEQKDVLIATMAGIYRLKSGHVVWEHVGAPADWVFCVHVTSDNRFIAAASFGVHISGDEGSTWSKSRPEKGWYVDYDEKRGIVYAATDDGLYRSSNDGESWESIHHGVRSTMARSIKVLDDSTIIAGIAWSDISGGVYVSRNQGDSWIERSDGLSARDVYWIETDSVRGTIYASSPHGDIYRTSDTGRTWTSLQMDWRVTHPYPVIAIDGDGRIYLGGDRGGVHLSTDFGDSWTEISSSELREARIYCMTVNESGDVFVGGQARCLYTSRDMGNSWMDISQGLTGADVFCLAFEETGNLLAGVTNGGGFRLSMTPVSANPAFEVHDMKLSQNYPNPFTSTTRIPVCGWDPSKARSLLVYDQLGREVIDLTEEVRNGDEVVIDRSLLPSAGLYFYQLTTDNGVQTRRMLVIH